MVCTRQANASCKLLNRLVFADANFFINVIDSVGMPLLNNHDTWAIRFNNFKTGLTQVLRDCCTCTPDSRINTSDLVAAEINPLNATSALRRESAFFGRVCGECRAAIYDHFFTDVNQIMGTHAAIIGTEPVPRDALRDTLLAAPTPEIRNLCANQTPNEGLSPSDLSLIVAAITESNARGVSVIITEDEDLRKAVEYLYGIGTIAIQEDRLTTRQLFHWGILMYASSLHKCCLFSNELELLLLQNVASNDIARPMAEKKRKLKSNHVYEAIGSIIQTLKTKSGVAT